MDPRLYGSGCGRSQNLPLSPRSIIVPYFAALAQTVDVLRGCKISPRALLWDEMPPNIIICFMLIVYRP